MQLHIADKTRSSWSMRAWLFLKAHGIPFEEIEHDYLIDNIAQQQAWKAFSPTSQVPVLIDDGLTIWDSLAIVQYIHQHFPHTLPNDKKAQAFIYSACAEMHSGYYALRNQCNFSTTFVKSVLPDSLLSKELNRLNDLWAQGLSTFGGPFLAGEQFTAVDAFFAPVVLRLVNYDLLGYMQAPARNYIQHMMQYPLLQEWCHSK